MADKYRDTQGRFLKGCPTMGTSKKEKIVKICKCGKEFSVKPSLDRVKHCSQSCAKKGNPSPNKGVIASKETREKQRIAKLGIRGKNHHNYRGYHNKSDRKIAMSQDEYVQWRKAVFQRDDYTCQCCNKRGCELHADHIVPWSASVELRYNLNNGRTLCVDCHRQTDTWGTKALKYKANQVGG